VNELDDSRQFLMVSSFVPNRASGEQHQRRTHALATAADDVFGDLPYEHYVRVQAVAYNRIDSLHVGAD
jgi:hypothetical protein